MRSQPDLTARSSEIRVHDEIAVGAEPDGIGDDQTVAVYLPMSYQLGGFTLMVPKDKITPVDMKVDQAMQFVLTAGVSAENKEKQGSTR